MFMVAGGLSHDTKVWVSRGQSDPNQGSDQDGGQPALRHKSPHCRVIIQGKGLLTLVRNGCFMNCAPLTAVGLVIIYYVFMLLKGQRLCSRLNSKQRIILINLYKGC